MGLFSLFKRLSDVKEQVLPVKPWQSVESVFATTDPKLAVIWKLVSDIHYLPPNFPKGKVVFSEKPDGNVSGCYHAHNNQISFFPKWYSAEECAKEGLFPYQYDVPIHELGHAIDEYLGDGYRSWSDSDHPVAETWRKEIKHLIEREKKMQPDYGDDTKYKYNWHELFARCYVMWIALHTDNPRVDSTVYFSTSIDEKPLTYVRPSFPDCWYFTEQDFWDHIAPHFYRMLGPWHLWKSAKVKS